MTKKAKERKDTPVYSGVLNYFPDAIMEVAKASKAGNDQHHPDKPLHWDKSKSYDHADSLTRHLLDAGKIDDDGVRHSAKVAWRALALLQIELEREAQEEWEEEIIERSKEEDIMYSMDGECNGELGSHPLCSTDYCPCWEEEIDKEIEALLGPIPGSVDAHLKEIEEEEREKRMNVIGQNGNDGLHYGIDTDGRGYVKYPFSSYPESNSTSTLYPGDIKITYDEIQTSEGKEDN